jgi:hypothetical protein
MSLIFSKNNMENRFYEFRNIPDFIVPFARTDLVKKMPTYSLPSVWNNAGVITLHDNRKTFMIALKQELFSSIQDEE